MKTRLVRIGNSRGVRLPKPLIEEAGISDEVELRARQGSIVILSASCARAGWAEAAERLRAEDSRSSAVIDDPGTTRFDRERWRW
jgi:antitoxin MazE